MIDFYQQNKEIIFVIAYLIIGMAIAIYLFKDSIKGDDEEFDKNMFNIIATFVAVIWPLAVLFVGARKLIAWIKKLTNEV